MIRFFIFLLMSFLSFELAGQIITNTPVLKFGSSNCRAVGITPDGKYVITAVGEDILVWDASASIIKNHIKGHTAPITCLEISRNGKYLVTGSEDKTVKLWNLESFSLMNTFRGHEARVSSVSFSPNNEFIASGSFDMTAKIWRLNSKRVYANLEGHSNWVTSVDFSTNSQYIITGSADKTAKLWNFSQKTEIGNFSGHFNGAITKVVLSPDGEMAFIGSDDGFVRSFNIHSNSFIQRYAHKHRYISDIAISLDGKRMAVSAGPSVTIHIFNKENKTITYEAHAGAVIDLVFSYDNQYILSSALDKTVKLWDATNLTTYIEYLKQRTPVNVALFSNNNEQTITGSEEGKIEIWAIQNGNAIKAINAHEAPITALAISGRNNYILSGSEDKSIKLWDVENEKLIKTFEGHKGTIRGLAFAPDNQTCISISEDKTIRSWDIASGTELQKVKGHNSFITGLQIAPDSSSFATCGEDRFIKIWDLKSFELKSSFKGHETFISTLKYTPDGKYICTGDWNNLVKMWDAQKGELVHVFEGHLGPISSLSFSPDGDFLVTGSKDNTLRIWDIESQYVTEILDGHKDEITSVTFSNDGQYILSTSKDRSVQLWLAGFDMMSGNEITADNNQSLAEKTRTNQREKTPLNENYTPPVKPILNDKISISWRTPSERRYRNEPYMLNDNQLEIEIELESEFKIDPGSISLLINGVKGFKFSETALTEFPSIGMGKTYYSFVQKLKFVEPGTYHLILEYKQGGKVLRTSETLTVIYEPQKVNLFLLSIGTNPVDLKYPANDATDFANIFTDHSLYKKVYTRKLVGEEATATRIKLELSRLQKNRFVSKRDVVMVFISSHGMVREGGSFSIQANDFDLIDPDETSIAFSDITGRLNDLECKKVLFLDACHSGIADPDLIHKSKKNSSTATSKALNKLLIEKDGWLMITSSGDEPSWEHDSWQNGSFTEALVTALKNGEADTDENGFVSIKELFLFLKGKVPALNKSVNFPLQTPQMVNTLGDDLEIFQLNY